ncbi:MAG: polyphenol oxidase family protein [Bdellovibrionales bacterium]
MYPLKTIYFKKEVIGWQYEVPGALVFFSNKKAQPEMLSEIFSIPSIYFLKQVHGPQVVEAVPLFAPQEADGHWTKEILFPLGIHTADCIPLLLYHPPTRYVAALHAGWKGVETRILNAALQQMKTHGLSTKEVMCFSGPHISKKSFEVGADVAQRLSFASPGGQQFVLPHSDPNKKYVDLLSIVKDQFVEDGGDLKSFFSLEKDTFSDPDFFSFRREGGTGRLISFISLN